MSKFAALATAMFVLATLLVSNGNTFAGIVWLIAGFTALNVGIYAARPNRR